MPQLVVYNTNSKQNKKLKKKKKIPNNLNRIQIFMNVFIAYKIENIDYIGKSVICCLILLRLKRQHLFVIYCFVFFNV